MEIHVDSRYAHLLDYLKDIPRHLMQGEGESLHEGRNSVRAFDADGVCMVVKRYKPVCFVRQIAYTFFCRTKARKAFLFAGILRERGFDTPHEVAYIEERKYGLFHVGYFISLRSDDPTVCSALVDVPDFDKALASALAALFVEMHRKGVMHGDMNLGNFLFHKAEDGHYVFTIIDTNRSRFFGRELSRRECLRNLRMVTYRRDLFEYIIRTYAALRGWDEEKTLREALRLLVSFERRKNNKRIWKERLKNLRFRR